MDSFDQQELRARQALSLGAVFKATFLIGSVYFIMSGGSPWTTAGTMNMIMGRDLVGLSFTSLLLGHFAVSLLYAWIIGAVIYRLPTAAAVPVGILLSVALYFANFVAFNIFHGQMHSPEFVTGFVHVTYGLFVSLMYKAFSIPKIARA